MENNKIFILLLILIPVMIAIAFLKPSTICSTSNECGTACSINPEVKPMNNTEIEKEYKNKLSPEAYRILREKATEKPFTGKYYHNKDTGIYYCAACDNELFTSDTKYDSGSGWPSFYKPVSDKSIITKIDSSAGMQRTEVLCGNCKSHLGHVFNDGPKPT